MMSVIYDLLYMIGLVLALPVVLIKSLRTGKYRSDWGARLGRYGAVAPLPRDGLRQKRLMLHCVSVGELLSVRHLVDTLLAKDSHLHIIITTTTDTGTARARDIYGAPAYRARVDTYRYPLDFSFAVRGFLRHARPDAIALVELETWPNFIRLANKVGIPVVVINGRLTARSLKRYKIIRPVIAAMMRQLTWLGIQTQTIADRFQALGAAPERIEIIPTLKYDTADMSGTVKGAAELGAACGLRSEHQVFVGGSTGPGEEVPLLQTYLALRGTYPQLRLAIATRKPETTPAVLAAIDAAGLKAVLRTQRPDTAPGADLGAGDVLVLNTMGELKKLYSLGLVCFVGRSLVPLGGSDMIEAAALAKPVCFGPHTHNFAEAVELLTSAGAAVVLPDAAAMTPTVERWLADPAAATRMGRAAQQVIAAQRGSTATYVAKLEALLAERP